ncbi:GxxExxY protein [Alkalilimnicola sp. S0819]|uniref:GxxExxY protein n=1 Tax=Alkalilimnicola sp. S0819 TaxID=2613922 RepID=UPI0012613E85|nr:GxxExxY protein [Alkalilimnicola sp. S0819]KAB7623003.1 GxxExxY protein [Alkalilimnicola sp. S0819]MPQ17115.1 GxxExxY protein [Alkalilimnicola sp. S0819]
MEQQELNELTERVIGAAVEVHRTLGPGLLESAYEAALCRELQLRNLSFRRQVSLPVRYKGISLNCGYRIDILVAERLPLELKAVTELADIHLAQLLTYLRHGDFRLGLLLNFNTVKITAGIRRVANRF